MDSPRTPAGSDRGVGSYVQGLNLKWRLSLPTGKWSPSPRSKAQSNEEVDAQKCVDCIRLLYFKDRAALERVVKNFEDVSRDSIPLSGWVYKPNQEHDTLPGGPMAPADSFPRRPDVSWPSRCLLTRRLLKFLESEAEPLGARMRLYSMTGAAMPRMPTVTTAGAIGADPPIMGRAGLEDSTEASQGRALEPHRVPEVGKQSERAERDHRLDSMPGPSRPYLSEKSATESSDRSGTGDNSGYSRSSAKVYESLYPQLGESMLAAANGGAAVEISLNERTHLGGATTGSNRPATSHRPRPEKSEGMGMEGRQHPVSGITSYGDLPGNAADIIPGGRTGKRKSRLFGEQRKGDDSEDEEFFTSWESPPSPSTDYESRRQRKACKRANAEYSFRKTEDWVPVHLPLSSPRNPSTDPARSRKRSSIDSTAPRHRNLPRAFPDEGSPYLVKVNTYLVQDSHSRPSFQPKSFPAVPPFPQAPSAGTSLTTSANTSFTESIFSDVPDDKQTDTRNTSFQEPATEGQPCSKEIEMTLGDGGVAASCGDEAIALGEWGDEDVEMALQVDRGVSHSPNLSQTLQDMTIQSPEKAKLPFHTNGGHSAGPVGVGVPSGKAKSALTAHKIEERLIKHSPFGQKLHEGLERYSLRVRYEISRVALECDISVNELAAKYPSISGEYDEMWSWLQRTVQLQNKNLPERSNAKAWELAGDQFENVVVTGELLFSGSRRNPLSASNNDPIFSFRLNPLKVESSCRLFRRFGNDRFIVIDLPVMSSLPARWGVDKDVFREGLLNWLVKGSHGFLGREWKAFYLKHNRRKGNTKRGLSATNTWSVYFFAVDGCDFHEGMKPPVKGEAVGEHSRMKLGEMLEWFMPFTPNLKKTCCKAFARLQLGVSQTRSTLVFRPEEIVHISDTLGDAVADSTERKIMNDGCARISRPAARAIAEMLCIDGITPSAFQGRIAGAKGLWMIDPSENPPHVVGDRGYWIEITDQQLKFERHAIDLYQPDDDRVTFEVNSWSKEPKAAFLSFQLLPILECQGVSKDIIEKHLREGLESQVSDLMESLEDPVAFRKWNHDFGGAIGERLKNQGVEFLGGLPVSSSERINWFLESGFRPKDCAFLRDLAKELTMNYCETLRKKMHIGIGQSTFVFCVADPLGVLKEGEVHFGFSTTFHDPRSTFEDTMLHGVDVLVARLPAFLPSDVQKVHAVFKPELRLLKDVIVFPTNGSIPLADKLSGGDYDGDRVWVCWDPEIVKGFKNAPVPGQKPLPELLEYYGISQDKLCLADLPGEDLGERTIQFVHRGFKAELEEGLLGICTKFHEKFCYWNNSIDNPEALDLAALLGLLVDRAKQGYVFSKEDWDRFRRKISPQVPTNPAYQEDDESRQTDHIIDHLVFRVAKPTVDKVLIEFNERFPEKKHWDRDLVNLWKQEKDSSKLDLKLREVLDRLEKDIRGVRDYWVKFSKKSGFKNMVSHTYAEFDKIMPKDTDHPLARRWREDANRSPISHWRLLRASAMIERWPNSKVAWWVAGRELGQLKALASGGYHMVVTPIHASYKPDGKFVRRANIKRITGVDVDVESVMGDEGDEEEFESVFGYDDWPDELCEAAG